MTAYGPEKKFGAIAPLFDRLTDLDLEASEESPVFGLLDNQALKASIFKEINRILSTRLASKGVSGPTYGLSSSFGLDPEDSLSGASLTSQGKIAKIVQKAIQDFEPRLRECQVHVLGYDASSQKISLSVGGMLKLGLHQEKVSFETQIPL